MQSDSRLVKLFRSGVDPAFDEFVRRYRGVLVAYAGAIAGRDRAEDVVQDSLLKAHKSLSDDQEIEPKPWLYKVVRNTALNDIRDNKKHSHDGLRDSAGRVAQPQEVAEQREELAAVVAAVSALPASQRRALIGHELGGYSYGEIAHELDVSTGATKQLIHRARLSLRNGFGALIPFPVIAWLVSDATGIYAAGAATTGAAAGALSAASGGVTVGATGTGGFFAGLAGTGTTKLAVAAIVAGGSIGAGVAAERHYQSAAPQSTTPAVSTADAGEGSSSGGSSGPQIPASTVAAVDGNGQGKDSEGSGHSSGDNRPQSGSGDHSDSSGGDDSNSPHRDQDDSSSGHDQPRPEGNRPDHSGPGSGDESRPHGSDDGGGDDDGSSDSSSGGSGSSGSGSSGSGSSDSGLSDSGSSDSGSSDSGSSGGELPEGDDSSGPSSEGDSDSSGPGD